MLRIAQAQTMHEEARARGSFLLWFITDADPAHPGKVTARAHTSDQGVR